MSIFVALGSNLGDRLATLRRSVREMEAMEITVAVRSAVYRTSPVDLDTPHAFFNAVVEVKTELTPHALLDRLLAVEQRLGRRRQTPRGDRTCDLDLLVYRELCLDEPDLRLPHPRMTHRLFVLLPLLDVAPDLRDPRSGRSYAEFARQLAGDPRQSCEKIRGPKLW